MATYGSADMVVLVTITQVYRREGAEWQLVHRHADPLANGISVEQAADLARGDRG